MKLVHNIVASSSLSCRVLAASLIETSAVTVSQIPIDLAYPFFEENCLAGKKIHTFSKIPALELGLLGVDGFCEEVEI